MKNAATKKKATKSAKAVVPYVTKRVIVSSSKIAAQKAVTRAIQTAGYLIKARNGWVIREEPNGSFQQILKYKSSKNYPFAID